MGKSILCDCQKVKEASMLLKSKEEEFSVLLNRLSNLSNEMKKDWEGADADKFFLKFDYYIKHLKSVPEYLHDKSALLEKASTLHGKYDSDLDNKIRRRYSNEPNN